MRRGARIALAVLGIYLAVVLTAIVGVGVWVWRSGMMVVEILREDRAGVELSVPVPLALVDLGMRFGDSRELALELQDLRWELEPVWPYLEGVAEELEAMPPATLLEIRSDHDHLELRKLPGGDLEILIDSPGGGVRLTLPADLLERVMKTLDRLSRQAAVEA